MALDESTRQRIASLIEANPVMLFMKGSRSLPQCGFSAQTVQILDQLVEDYETFDVLSDFEIRNGIKEYSSWPTIPQLYVKGELVGGCDIVKELYATGELHESLGLPRPEPAPAPTLTITEAAARAMRDAQASTPDNAIQLRIDARFEHSLFLAAPAPGEIEVESNGVAIRLDPVSAQRAEGVVIDSVQSEQGAGFKIDNPNAERAAR